MDIDIVSSSGQFPEKFIRELSIIEIASTVIDEDLIFPVRGKVKNAFNCSRESFFSNEEVQGITRIILGGDYKRNFNVEDCKVEKVIFMADGDVDRLNCPKMLYV